MNQIREYTTDDINLMMGDVKEDLTHYLNLVNGEEYEYNTVAYRIRYDISYNEDCKHIYRIMDKPDHSLYLAITINLSEEDYDKSICYEDGCLKIRHPFAEVIPSIIETIGGFNVNNCSCIHDNRMIDNYKTEKVSFIRNKPYIFEDVNFNHSPSELQIRCKCGTVFNIYFQSKDTLRDTLLGMFSDDECSKIFKAIDRKVPIKTSMIVVDKGMPSLEIRLYNNKGQKTHLGRMTKWNEIADILKYVSSTIDDDHFVTFNRPDKTIIINYMDIVGNIQLSQLPNYYAYIGKRAPIYSDSDIWLYETEVDEILRKYAATKGEDAANIIRLRFEITK